MKIRLLLPSLFFLITFLSNLNAFAQIQTAKYVSMNAITNAYYEYLPEGYNPSGSERYPLLLFIHGSGERGPGTSSSLPTVLRNGPPKLINEGKFPASFKVGGKTFRFIVISPQFVDWPTYKNIDAVVDYLEAHYHVDPTRIYVTGLSMGGGVTWEYAGNSDNPTYVQKVAAIVPVCGASYPSVYRARMMAKYNLPVWAFHNDEDPTVPVSYTNDYVAEINEPPAPNPPARKTIFHASGHDAWSKAYDPNYKEAGKNVYEWMLQYTRPAMEEAPLPIVLSNYSVSRTGDGKVLVSWATSFEQNNAYFTIERSRDGTIFSQLARITAADVLAGSTYSFLDETPFEGTGYYRLVQTDKDGKTTLFPILQAGTARGGGESYLLSVYPNPAENQVELVLKSAGTGKIGISILDQVGKRIRTNSYYKQQSLWKQQISLAGLTAGCYYIEVKDVNGKKFIRRIMKK